MNWTVRWALYDIVALQIMHEKILNTVKNDLKKIQKM